MILKSRNKLFSVRSLENNDNENIPLKKLAFNSWNDSDSYLPLSILTKHSTHEARQEARDLWLCHAQNKFYWVIKRKPKIQVLTLGGGSFILQPCFRGGSVIFLLRGGGGPYVFYQPHFQMLCPPKRFDKMWRNRFSITVTIRFLIS